MNEFDDHISTTKEGIQSNVSGFYDEDLSLFITVKGISSALDINSWNLFWTAKFYLMELNWILVPQLKYTILWHKSERIIIDEKVTVNH